MTRDELIDALVGLYAYDTGCTDSGIHDVVLKAKCVKELETLPLPELTIMIREQWLTDEKLADGYTIEDVHLFITWLADEMDFDL